MSPMSPTYGEQMCPTCERVFVKSHHRRIFCGDLCKRINRVTRTQAWRDLQKEILQMNLEHEDEHMTLKPWMLTRYCSKVDSNL